MAKVINGGDTDSFENDRIATDDFRVPRPNAVLVTETLPVILSDKIRALLERRDLKGREITIFRISWVPSVITMYCESRKNLCLFCAYLQDPWMVDFCI